MYVDFSPPDITNAGHQEVADVLRPGWITTGPRTKTLERQVAQRCGATRAACLNSAIASLELTLRILGIGPGDEVTVPVYTYTASVSPVVHVGAIPVIVDTGRADGDYGLDPGTLKTAITPRTKVVIPVDIGRRIYDYPVLYAVVGAYSHLFASAEAVQEALGRAALITDSAHDFGTWHGGTPLGSTVDLTTFSPHAVKNLTTAEGGAVAWKSELGSDEELYRQYMLLSSHGQSKDALPRVRLGAWEYDIVSPAYKCNMTDMCAAIGLVQTTHYDSMPERRHRVTTLYDQTLAPVGVTPLRYYEDGNVSSGRLYLVNLPGLGGEARNEFIERMARVDVVCNVRCKPLPLLSARRDPDFFIENFPQAYALYASKMSLPLHTSLTDGQVNYVISCVLEILAVTSYS